MDDEPRTSAVLPDALADVGLRELARSGIAVFLDYDGTLTPIVARPELAVPPAGTAEILEGLARRCVVGIISGRDVDDLRGLIEPEGVWMAGSHGFDIRAPDGSRHLVDAGRPFPPLLGAAADDLEAPVAAVPGAWVERKTFAVAVHYRQVDDALIPRLDDVVDTVARKYAGLRRTGGKRVFELRPDIEWDKGRALWLLLEMAQVETATVTPVYIGDDVTDEDAFASLEGHGVGIVVTEEDRPTAATRRLADPNEVRALLAQLTKATGGSA